MNDVDDILLSARLCGGAILLEQRLVHGAAGGYIADCELTVGISE